MYDPKMREKVRLRARAEIDEVEAFLRDSRTAINILARRGIRTPDELEAARGILAQLGRRLALLSLAEGLDSDEEDPVPCP